MMFDPSNTPYSFGQRPNPGRNILDWLRRSHLLNRIVLFFIVLYALYLLTWLYMYLFAVPLRFDETDFRFFVKYLALPSSPELFCAMPWTIITHFIVHTSLFTMLFHVLVMVVFGRLFFEFWHNGRFVFLFVSSALAGALGFLYATTIFPSMNTTDGSMLTGAGAAVFGLMLYMFVYMPEHVFKYMMVVQLKMKYLVLIVIALDLLSFQSAEPGIHLSHLAGALFGAGFAFVSKSLKRKFTFSSGMKKTASRRNRKNLMPFLTRYPNQAMVASLKKKSGFCFLKVRDNSIFLPFNQK
jgi:membrane associated rhomboid family serine protease